MTSFIENYPKINDWVKCIHALNIDDYGNKTVTEECRNYFETISNNYLTFDGFNVY